MTYLYFAITSSILLIAKLGLVYILLCIRPEKSSNLIYYSLLAMVIGTIPESLPWITDAVFNEYGIFPFILGGSNLVRLAWPCTLFGYQAFNLLTKNTFFRTNFFGYDQWVLLFINFCVTVFYIYRFIYNHYDFVSMDPIETRVAHVMLIILSVHFVGLLLLKLIRPTTQMPSAILDHQYRHITKLVMILPAFYYLGDGLRLIYPEFLVNYPYERITLLYIVFVVGMYWCIKNLLRYRFLNFHQQIQPANFNRAVDILAHSMAEIQPVTSFDELRLRAQLFIEKLLNIKQTATQLYIRPLEEATNAKLSRLTLTIEQQLIEKTVEQFFQNFEKPKELLQLLCRNKVINRHEMEYDALDFINTQEVVLLGFMKSINADIFVPLVHKKLIVGYLIIEHNPQPDSLITYQEAQEIWMYSQQVMHIIQDIHGITLDAVLKRNEELELAGQKEQHMLNHIKEGVTTLVDHYETQDIGVVQLDNDRMRFCNVEAGKLLGITMDQQSHPIMRSLTNMAQATTLYNKPIRKTIQNADHDMLIAQSFVTVGSSVMINLIRYNAHSYIVDAKKILADPEDWPHALALHTTKSGKLINRVYPGTDISLIRHKVNLLKYILSEKPLVVALPAADLNATLDVIATIGIRPQVHVIDCAELDSGLIDIKIFGIDKLYDDSAPSPLLSTLSQDGLLCLTNIQHLAIEQQKRLLAYIETGSYMPLRGSKRCYSRTRLIFTLSGPAPDAAMDPEFIAYLETQKVDFPNLALISSVELDSVISGTEQQLHVKGAITPLQIEDRKRIIGNRPATMAALREEVDRCKRATPHSTVITYDDNNPIESADTQHLVMEAIRQGANAVHNKILLQVLWNKYHNHQKISDILGGVSRSTVSRWCSKFGVSSDAETEVRQKVSSTTDITLQTKALTIQSTEV